MQDRRRTVLRLPQHAGPVLLRERQSSSSAGPSDSSGSSGASGSSGPSAGSSGSPGGSGSGSDDNPFAPPPEGSPDQPWSPRHRPQGGSEGGEEQGGGTAGDERPVWGSQWSGRQPGRSGDGFGGRTGGQGQDGPGPRQGQGQGGGPGGGMRWDPTDVYQRRARYALLAGMWAFFFSLFSVPEVALLLGVLAIYWAVSSLRAKNRKNGAAGEEGRPAGAGSPASRRPDPFAPPPHQEAYPSTSDRAYAHAGVRHTPSPEEQTRPQHAVAVSGLVAAGLGLLIVASTYSMQFVYSDYYSCVHDALTHEGQVACNSHLPKSLVPFLGISD